MKKVDIIIPCFNENKNIKKLVSSWSKALSSDRSISIYFINNGSTDNTGMLLKKEIELSSSENLHVLEIKKNRGYGHGIKHGIQNSKSEIICWTHADLQIPVYDVINIVRKYQNNLNNQNYLYKGNRNKRKIFDLLFTKLMSFVGLLFTGIYINDINAQPKIFSRSNVSDFKNYPDDFTIDAHILYSHKKKNKLIQSYNSTFLERTGNDSKGGGSLIGKINLSFKTISYFVNFNKHFI